jgi:hypothetical protein
MPATPPSGAPLAPPQTSPPTTRHAAVPIDAREWRMRTEVRCNAVLIMALFLFGGAGLTTTVWIAVVALVLGVVLLALSCWLRPTLPWRSPTRRLVDDADLTVMTPPVATPPYPIAAAMPPADWAAVAAVEQRPAAAVNGARVERVRPARGR